MEIITSRQFAKEMALMAIQIREEIKKQFSTETRNGFLHQVFQEFKEILLQDLNLEMFADICAQTITYGLFSARITHKGEFNVSNFSTIVPNTNPFLKCFFGEISKFCQSLGTTSKDLGLFNLFELFKVTNINALFQDLERYKKSEDPVLHFYENFLHYYGPDQKIKRGVFYTPDSIVSFMVRSVDKILRNEFSCTDGLADDSCTSLNHEKVSKVQILDPATGTGTFLSHIIDSIYSTFREKHKHEEKHSFLQNWNTYVNNTLLTRLFGFEFLITPYIIAHLNLSLKLQDTGFQFQTNTRLGVYLTDALENPYRSENPNKKRLITKETIQANRIKRDRFITVIIGNPPYSKISHNKNHWINALLRGKNDDGTKRSNYFQFDGKPIDERNPKWLNDDYVKFIRFAQWRIEKTGLGIVAFITNHGFLENPTFRGMRQQLMQTFTSIYILDLHGNIRKSERCPTGSRDQNVFDIQQGVCIVFFIKNPANNVPATIYRLDLWGLRDQKYKFLSSNNLYSLKWQKITPTEPNSSFMNDENPEISKEFKEAWNVSEIFKYVSSGITTSRDSICLQNSADDVWNVVNSLLKYTNDEIRALYDLKQAQNKLVNRMKNELKQTNLSKDRIKRILFRPFDFRYTYYTGKSNGFLERPRIKLMRHFLNGNNIALLWSRPQSPNYEFSAFITDILAHQCVVGNKSAGGGNSYVGPLFIFEKNKQNKIEKKLNINSEFIEVLNTKLVMESENLPKNKDFFTLKPLKIFQYMYAIFYSPSYRKRYASQLRLGYPRVPVTSKKLLFDELCEKGSQLINLHLSDPRTMNCPIIMFKSNDNTFIKKIERVGATLKINKDAFFDNIPNHVLNFQIGGYYLCKQWLKDRKGRSLTQTDIKIFQSLVFIIDESYTLMKEIDKIIDDYGGWPLT
ncbi:MAG: type ISP restriction/modification enzyme [Promethearchaeota archaeon]